MCSCMVCRVSATLTPTPVRRPSATTAPRRRTRVLALPEARWALTSTLAFLFAFPLDLAGASAWLYGPLYVIAYAAGGWEPALEGLRALREKSLDVDLLMIVAALGAAAIGQVLDGALLIVIFVFAFFKFTWSLRLFNYLLVLIGAAPLFDRIAAGEAAGVAQRAARMSNLAVNHFNVGIRAYYFGLAALAWFVHPLLFVAASAWVVVVLWRREFRSHTLAALKD